MKLGLITISSVVGSPSNSSSTSYYTNTPNHQALSSVSSNYDGQSPTQVQSTSHTRRPTRNHHTTTARSTPNLPTSTPVHNIHSPMFSTQSTQPAIKPQSKHCYSKETYYNNTTSTSSTSQASSSVNYRPQTTNAATIHPNQPYLSSTTVSSTSAASIAAGRDAFTGNFSRQMSPSSPPICNNQSSTSQLARVEEKVSGRGITRSSASYGIQKLLQEQVRKDR